jgi:ubiquinone/menaquinone biosynthesis C-methylase UbiE
MDVEQAYNKWAGQYDINSNKTRDLEAISLRTALQNIQFSNCLELGCGTGKNTEWLMSKAKQVMAVDFSIEMLAKAREKIKADNVQFIQADINKPWTFVNQQYDLITFSLVLEHVEHLNGILEKASNASRPQGIVYIGELHPFKQYAGTKARFDTEAGEQNVPCFNHHVSDFTLSAKNNDFEIMEIGEYFDDNDKTTIPRILTLLLVKK